MASEPFPIAVQPSSHLFQENPFLIPPGYSSRNGTGFGAISFLQGGVVRFVSRNQGRTPSVLNTGLSA